MCKYQNKNLNLGKCVKGIKMGRARTNLLVDIGQVILVNDTISVLVHHCERLHNNRHNNRSCIT